MKTELKRFLIRPSELSLIYIGKELSAITLEDNYFQLG
jgi:hypothetical protein